VIEGFSHVQLVVRDVPASAEWYCAELCARDIDASAVLEEAQSYNVQIVDPNGLVLELSAPKRSRS
jgi:catechol 2,3-dioxygenase-like lactoylglutathione lyase family enzyme